MEGPSGNLLPIAFTPLALFNFSSSPWIPPRYAILSPLYRKKDPDDAASDLFSVMDEEEANIEDEGWKSTLMNWRWGRFSISSITTGMIFIPFVQLG
jgi:hypothetical protein